MSAGKGSQAFCLLSQAQMAPMPFSPRTMPMPIPCPAVPMASTSTAVKPVGGNMIKMWMVRHVVAGCWVFTAAVVLCGCEMQAGRQVSSGRAAGVHTCTWPVNGSMVQPQSSSGHASPRHLPACASVCCSCQMPHIRTEGCSPPPTCWVSCHLGDLAVHEFQWRRHLLHLGWEWRGGHSSGCACTRAPGGHPWCKQTASDVLRGPFAHRID